MGMVVQGSRPAGRVPTFQPRILFASMLTPPKQHRGLQPYDSSSSSTGPMAAGVDCNDARLREHNSVHHQRRGIVAEVSLFILHASRLKWGSRSRDEVVASIRVQSVQHTRLRFSDLYPGRHIYRRWLGIAGSLAPHAGTRPDPLIAMLSPLL